ncbi:MAG: glycosyltransferase, partial [Candidatus Geothermarchaeales archaeon]
RLEDYEDVAGKTEIAHIEQMGEALEGRSVLHVNATAYGGGPAEMLARLIPLTRDTGLEADWMVLDGSPEFFQTTKNLHNALQGSNVDIDRRQMETYLTVNKANAATLPVGSDFVVIHDPQPCALVDFARRDGGVWAWRCHIDLSKPYEAAWRFLSPFVEMHDALIFTLQDYVPRELQSMPVSIIPPSIDPLSDKNRALDHATITDVLEEGGIDPERPLVTQISRYDPWKDPLGVVDVYRLVKQEIPDLQLLMAGSMASDDPEGTLYYDRTVRHAGDDPDLHLLTNLTDSEVNAFQRASDVILQKSIREGFGLTVTEALWKERAVVAGNTGGIPTQIIDGETGFLVNTTEEMAKRTLWLLRHPEERAEMGRKAHEHVRRRFLITRLLRDYLSLFGDMAKRGRS